MTEDHDALWGALLSAHGRIADRIDRDLTDRADITLAEFEVLDHLADAHDNTIRMNELAERVRLSPSGLTRRFDTLVRRGWVTREPCDDDRRGINAGLTPDGIAMHAGAAGVHEQGVTTYLLDNLDDHEVECLTRVLGRLAETNAPQRLTRASV